MPSLFLLLLLGVTLPGTLVQNVSQPSANTKVPAPIRQGPWNASAATTGDPYWYQTGALGGSASYNYVAATVMIKTVHDLVNNDAHSYWVGGFIANGAFVQVGFLNEITTTGQAYCCAWFFEYFLPASSFASGCCAPVIGREGSAGPIESWHNYTMTSNENGIWSFYMDGTLLGRSVDLGGASAANSGGNSPGAVAEVASASSNTDIIGPGEFKNLSFRVSGGNWQTVPQAKSLIWYGKGSFDHGSPPVNPYGAREVEGLDNDFLAGSFIPPLNTPTSPQNSSPSLWPTVTVPCCISFQFLDPEGVSLLPDWVSFNSSVGMPIFYTQYANQPIEYGTWTLKTVSWHSANITTPASPFTTPGTTSQSFPTSVFSIQLRVIGIISGLPVGGATVTTNFPDNLKETVSTDESGNGILVQLPSGQYSLLVSVPYGISTILSENVTSSLRVTARVFAIVEVLVIAGVPIAAAIAASALVVRREQKRRSAMPTFPPSIVVTENCYSCGRPLHLGQAFCTNCGAMVKKASS